ncbi:MAG: hypothetical protein ACI85I_002009 [Arenicella sp.]|jgi:hypothetical protein
MKQIEELIIDYLDGTLSKPDKIRLEKHLENNKLSWESLQEFGATSNQLLEMKTPTHSENLRPQFYANLAEWKQVEAKKQNSFFSKINQLVDELQQSVWFGRLAYGFALLIVGVWLGYQIRGNQSMEKVEKMASEMQTMQKTMFMSMIGQNSASKRIQAVSLASDFVETDDKVVEMLFQTLNQDENVNVRIVSAETLSNFTHLPTVRKRLIESLNKQESPLVQLTLVDIMLKINDSNSKQALKKAVENNELGEGIKQKAEAGLAM